MALWTLKLLLLIWERGSQNKNKYLIFYSTLRPLWDHLQGCYVYKFTVCHFLVKIGLNTLSKTIAIIFNVTIM